MTIRFSRQAAADLASALSYIAEDSPASAARVLQRIERTIETVAIFPFSGRVGDVDGTRQSAVPRTPYLIVYRVAGGGVQVLSILHGRRNRQPPDSP